MSAPPGTMPPMPETLNDRDREILRFEGQWFRQPGTKQQAIRDLFDLSATRYYQLLNALIDSPAALAAEPMTVKRLRRMRAKSLSRRSQSALAEFFPRP